MVEAVTVGVHVTAADPEEVIDPVTDGVLVLDVVPCAVLDPVCVVDAVPVFVAVAAGLPDPVGLLLAVTVGVTRGVPEPEEVPEAVGAVDPVAENDIDPD